MASHSLCCALLVAVVSCQCQVSQEYDTKIAFESWDMVQSVFVQREPGSPGAVSRFIRLHGDAADSPLFSAETPSTERPLAEGPLLKRRALGITVGQWLKASGTGSYHSDRETGHLRLAFRNLVAHGQYSVWQCRLQVLDVTSWEYCQSQSRPVLMDESDPESMSFVADGRGDATVSATVRAFDPLRERTRVVLFLVYHSEPLSRAPISRSIGRTMHSQMQCILPQAPPRSWLDYFYPGVIWSLVIGYAVVLSCRLRSDRRGACTGKAGDI